MMKSSTILLVACFIACSLAQIINPSAAALAASDNVALNYALTLENLEAAFYVQYQARFSAADFATAGYPSYVYTYFGLISAHETSHVNTLRTVLTSRSATPVAACTYNFGNITTVAQYIGVAKVLENVGVGAYDGSINRIYDASLQTAAATIATVEARHAAFLNLLTGDSPFPASVDNATTPTTVAGLITPFLVSCPGGAPILPNVSVVIPVAAPAGQPANPTQAQLTDNDVNALNYALTLEHLEATFYNQYQTTYNAAAFLAAGYSAGVYAYFEVIRGHENAHVAALTTTIQNFGRTPVVACTYNFGVTSVATYVATARLLENVGVTAYDGAVNTIFNGDLKVYAATIATVEARHAAFLNNLTGISPFPTATDNATLPIDIVGIITPLLVNCPTPLTAASLPVVRVVTPYSNGTTGATSGSTTSRVTTGTTSGSSSIVSAVSLSSAVLAAVVGLMAL